MVNIQIKDNSHQAKELVKYLKALPYVKFEEPTNYNPEFVKKVLKAAKGKSTKIQAKDIWQSIN
jgi:hypothetical protein